MFSSCDLLLGHPQWFVGITNDQKSATSSLFLYNYPQHCKS
jgi:hypothetical protein